MHRVWGVRVAVLSLLAVASAPGATRRTVVYDVTALHAAAADGLKSIGGAPAPLPPLRWGTGERVLFEDLLPGANWGHPARYRIVDRQGRLLREVATTLPPRELFAAPVVGPEEPAGAAVPIKIDDFHGAYRVPAPARFHALLLNGTGNPRHRNDMAFLYQVLTKVYGYLPAQVHIGDSRHRDTAGDLDGDGVPDIRYGSTLAEVRRMIEALRTEVKRGDHVLVVVNDHGTLEEGEARLVLHDGTMSAAELGTLLKRIPAERMLSIFEQCFSGAFVRPATALRRVAMAAAASHEYSWATPDQSFDEFLYHVIAAFGRQTHEGKAVDADLDRDGRISAQEAYAFAVGRDRVEESPLLESAANTGMQKRIGVGF